jgi:Fic family protein
MLYWPEFKFDFRFDLDRLAPHVIAIEAHQEAATNRILPPYWRERPAGEAPVLNLPPEKSRTMDPLDIRKQELMLRNADPVQSWARSRFAPGSAPISMHDITAMHRMVAGEVGIHQSNAGVLRSIGVRVGRREAGGMHSGAPSENLPLLMDLYIRFINGDRLGSLPAAVHALVAHFFFTTIHPFDDGNGRMARLVSAAILFQRGYNGHGSYAFSTHFYVNGIRYHSLLHQCWQASLPFDLTQFVAFGMEGLAIELQGISRFLKIKLHRTLDHEFVPPFRKRLESRRARLA